MEMELSSIIAAQPHASQVPIRHQDFGETVSQRSSLSGERTKTKLPRLFPSRTKIMLTMHKVHRHIIFILFVGIVVRFSIIKYNFCVTHLVANTRERHLYTYICND